MDRTAGQRGIWFFHFPCKGPLGSSAFRRGTALVGRGGSGTIFFSNYQNAEINPRGDCFHVSDKSIGRLMTDTSCRTSSQGTAWLIVIPPLQTHRCDDGRKCSSGAVDYPQHAAAAIEEMYRQVGNLVVDENGVALRGLITRHLVLPANISGTGKFVRWSPRS